MGTRTRRCGSRRFRRYIPRPQLGDSCPAVIDASILVVLSLHRTLVTCAIAVTIQKTPCLSLLSGCLQTDPESSSIINNGGLQFVSHRLSAYRHPVDISLEPQRHAHPGRLPGLQRDEHALRPGGPRATSSAPSRGRSPGSQNGWDQLGPARRPRPARVPARPGGAGQSRRDTLEGHRKRSRAGMPRRSSPASSSGSTWLTSRTRCASTTPACACPTTTGAARFVGTARRRSSHTTPSVRRRRSTGSCCRTARSIAKSRWVRPAHPGQKYNWRRCRSPLPPRLRRPLSRHGH